MLLYFSTESPPAESPPMNQTRHQRIETFLVGQINSFCNNDLRERHISNAASKQTKEQSHVNNSIQDGLNNMLIMSTAYRSKREAKQQFQSLLRIKFLDCILRETEAPIVAISTDNMSKKGNTSTLNRPKREVVTPHSNLQNKSFSHMTYKKIPLNNQTLYSPTIRMTTPLSTTLRQTSVASDLNTILDRYYDQYRNDVTASKIKIREVLCGKPLDSTSSEFPFINETWDTVSSSIEKHLDKVR